MCYDIGMKEVTIAGVSGSLRGKSYNTSLLRAAQPMANEHGLSIHIVPIGNMPLFNEDIERQTPREVITFKDALKNADGVLLVTPEYNYSISGSLKNALEWATRPHGENSLDAKPVGIMSASMGIFGGVRAQYHLRQILVGINAYVMNQPEIMVGTAQEKFDETGELIDAVTRAKVQEFLAAFAEWVKRFKK